MTNQSGRALGRIPTRGTSVREVRLNILLTKKQSVMRRRANGAPVYLHGGNDDARNHLRQSVANRVPRATILGAAAPEEHPKLVAIEAAGGGFYAWGAIPGERNWPTW